MLLREDQLAWLEGLRKEIMRSRGPGYKTERITENTIIRAAVDLAMQVAGAEGFSKENVADEEELRRRFRGAV